MSKLLLVLFFMIFSVIVTPVMAHDDDHDYNFRYNTPRWAPPVWDNHNPQWNTPHPQFQVLPRYHVIPQPHSHNYHPKFKHHRFHGARRSSCREFWHNGRLYRNCDTNNPSFFLSIPNFSLGVR